MKRCVGITVAVALAATLTARPARTQSYGTESPFVLGTSARVAALGVAGASLGSDASLQYFNPSSMSYVEWKELVVFRTQLFDSDALYHALSYTHPLTNNSAFGVTVMRLDIGGIEERDASNQLLADDVHNSQTRVLLGYSRHVLPALAAGLNVKIDNHTFGDLNGSGVGIDVGLSANQTLAGQRFFRGFRQGLALRNIVEPSIKLDRERVSDPLSLALGLSAISGFGHMLSVTSIDLVTPRLAPASLHVGQEFVYRRHLALRMGIDDTSPTYGFGARYGNFSLDYAYRREDIGRNHRVSLSMRFGSSVSERRAQERVRREQDLNNRLNERMAALENAQITRAIARGDSLSSAGDYAEARRQYEIALLWDSQNTGAADGITRCKYDESMELARAAVARGDYAQALLHTRAALNQRAGDPEATEIAAACNRRIADDRTSTETINQLLKTSIDLYANREFRRALAGFEEVLRISGSNTLAGEYKEKCEAQIKRIVGEYSKEAQAFLADDDYDGAVRRYEMALELDPTNREIKRSLADIAHRHAGPEPSDSLQQVPEDTGDNRMTTPLQTSGLSEKYQYGMELFDKGDYDKSIDVFRDVWSQDPQFHNVSGLLAKSHLFVGMRLYSDQKYDLAIRHWERALTVDPDNSKAKRYLSKAREEIKKLSGAGHG